MKTNLSQISSVRSALLSAALSVTLLATLGAAAAVAQTAQTAQTAPTPPPAAAGGMTAQPTLNDPVAAKREYELALKLRCLVCQNQSIAESNASLAVDLRNQVREQVAAGKSDSEIIDFMTTRYGDFVLYQPPLKGSTMLLWFGPLLLLAVGVFVAWRVVRARRAMPAPAPMTDQDRARAAALLQGEGSSK
jgi:cytochrome c-type biogenesis protein CcmH